MATTAVDDPVDPRAGLSPGAPLPRSRPADDGPAINWTGRPARDEGSDGDEGAGASGVGGGASGRRRLAVVAGIVSFAYVAWIIVDLVVLAASGSAYTTMHQALGSLGVRLVLCGAWLALLHHGLDGLRLTVVDFVPSLHARDGGLRAAEGFVLFATWIPTSLIILWPAIRGWFAT